MDSEIPWETKEIEPKYKAFLAARLSLDDFAKVMVMIDEEIENAVECAEQRGYDEGAGEEY